MRHQSPAALEPAKDEDGLHFEIGAYLEIVRKRLWIVAAVVVVGVTASVLYTLRQPKVYQATASVVIDPQPPQVFGSQVQEVVQLGAGSYWSNQEYYNTQVDILGSWDLAEQNVIANELYDNPDVLSPEEAEALDKHARIEEATRKVHSAVTVSQNRDSRVVNIHVTSTNASLAPKLANMHVGTYISYMQGLRVDGSGEVSQFLSSELDKAEARLRDSEEKLYSFKRDNDILSVSLEDKQNILANDLERYTAALSDARIKRIELATVRTRAQSLSQDDVLESPVFALASNSETVRSLKEQYMAAKQHLVELSQTLGPKNPVHIQAKEKVDDLHASIEREARRAVREIDEKYQAAQDAERRFSGELERLKEEAFALAGKTVQYKRLQRRQKNDEDNYNLMLSRLRTSEISSRNKLVNIRDLEKARKALLVSPKLVVNIVVAVAVSLVFGLGLAFLLNYLDRTIKSAEDVERLAGAPLLGMIPVIEEVQTDSPAALRERDLWVFRNPKSRAAECCRSIRTNIMFSGADRELRTITVSSARPREGKTTSTIYLGTTMAQSGQRVLIVDTDMRRPRIHKSMGLSKGNGLSTLILGETSLDDATKATDIPNLYVLPCGPQPPNPAELLLSQRFRDVLDGLSERFDRILLDSPPLLAVTDGVVLSRLSDGVILVAQGGKTNVDDVAQCARLLRDVDARVLGMILNDMDLTDRRYGYYYTYYGYGDAAADEPAASA